MTFISEFGINRALEWDRFIELAQHEAFTFPGKSLIGLLSKPNAWAPHIASSRQMQQGNPGDDFSPGSGRPLGTFIRAR